MKTILTQNLRKATKLTMQTIQTIQKNEMGVISGASGMGKSTFRQMLVNKLRADKYKVAYYVPFRSNRTQTNRILESIYEVAFPEQKILVNENRKIRHLKTSGNSKIVLVIHNM